MICGFLLCFLGTGQLSGETGFTCTAHSPISRGFVDRLLYGAFSAEAAVLRITRGGFSLSRPYFARLGRVSQFSESKSQSRWREKKRFVLGGGVAEYVGVRLRRMAALVSHAKPPELDATDGKRTTGRSKESGDAFGLPRPRRARGHVAASCRMPPCQGPLCVRPM